MDWISGKEIRKYGREEMPVVLVGNKIDMSIKHSLKCCMKLNLLPRCFQ